MNNDQYSSWTFKIKYAECRLQICSVHTHCAHLRPAPVVTDNVFVWVIGALKKKH